VSPQYAVMTSKRKRNTKPSFETGDKMESLTMKDKGIVRSLSRDEGVYRERGIAPLIFNFIVSSTCSDSRFGRFTASTH
jgi:hypothetical protein